MILEIFLNTFKGYIFESINFLYLSLKDNSITIQTSVFQP